MADRLLSDFKRNYVELLVIKTNYAVVRLFFITNLH